MFFLSAVYGYLLIYFASYSIFNKKDFEFLFITLFIIVSPVPILAFTNAWLIKYYFFLAFLSFAGLAINKYFNGKENNFFKKNISITGMQFAIKDYLSKKRNNFNLIYLSLAITFIFTYKFFPPFWRFEAHDLLYYSWLNEISIIDYQGSIRVPTAYPFLLSANHLTPGALLSPFLIINPKITLYSSYIVKYFLVIISFQRFIYNFLDFTFHKIKSNQSISRILFIFIISFLFLVYLAEIDYSIGISNYPLILLSLCIGSSIIKFKKIGNGFNNNDFKIIVTFILFCFLIAKATTLPTFFGTLFFVLLFYKVDSLKKFFSNIDKKYFLIIFLMLTLNFLSWIIPKSLHSLELAFPFCLIIKNGSDDILTCIGSVLKNPYNGWYVTSIKTDLLGSVFPKHYLLEYIYIWFLCLIPAITTGTILNKFSKSELSRFSGKFLISYSLSASLAIILIRDTRFTGGHTSHSYLFVPMLTILGILIYIIDNFDNLKFPKLSTKLIFSFLIVIAIVNKFDHSMVSRRTNAIKQTSKIFIPDISLTKNESKQFDKNFCTQRMDLRNKFGLNLDSNGCANNDLGEIKAALDGERTDISLFSESSIIKRFSINPKMIKE